MEASDQIDLAAQNFVARIDSGSEVVVAASVEGLAVDHVVQDVLIVVAKFAAD